MPSTVPTIISQEAFSQAVSRALHDLFMIATYGNTPDVNVDNEDRDVREQMAAIDTYAFRTEYAAMPTPGAAPPSSRVSQVTRVAICSAEFEYVSDFGVVRVTRGLDVVTNERLAELQGAGHEILGVHPVAHETDPFIVIVYRTTATDATER